VKTRILTTLNERSLLSKKEVQVKGALPTKGYHPPKFSQTKTKARQGVMQ